ncbi:hypothetical protein DL240_08615 [Lujinxingia litoralis]|uniref:FAD/NAD(P)-binding domain-containing protein n=1 Tax=Lujinxingia litoralis TaxID=2211119 RepID=A0A328C8L0_9DELT|nr:FAD-dependent oxidoreductase [Lujinxingia litoralis]RAL22944.1 hypothetical protein DL240_08615 [Lujinxingia litoralis]
MTTQSTHTVAMIGAGPASIYAAEVLAKAGHRVVMLNRDIKPGGLAEFGIYPTKYKMKRGLRRYFDRVLSHDNITYLGNVSVGQEADVSLEELRELGFDALVVAVGAQGTKWLGLPGEDAEACFHAKDLVYHYNGLPPFSEREFPVGQDVVVVGMGNVCLDIVHWMVCERQVRSVTAVARRGPGERAFTDKEFKLVSQALDTEALRAEFDGISEVLSAVGQDPEALHQEYLRYIEEPLESPSETSLKMRFLRSPARVEVDASGRVTGLTCEKTRLKPPGEKGRVGVERTGEFETLACDTVVFAIGDAIEPTLGLPLSPAWSGEFATVPEPWEAHPDRPRYMVYNPQTETPIWDTFVVGWARKASDGLVGKARADAVQGCDEILGYLQGAFAERPSEVRPAEDVVQGLDQMLRERNVRLVGYDEVKYLDELAAREAESRGLVEYKFATRAEMFQKLDEEPSA